MTDPSTRNAYDEVPYTSLTYSQTHPDRLATVATLLGLDPPPVEHCRVLEIGCASGGNLFPMAYALPHAQFVGFDYSTRQIADGQAKLEKLGLPNIRLEHKNILDIGPDYGTFDYIVAHGIYSWVPPEVRDKVLAVCQQNLAPNGIAYVSYNTYPGWHMLGAVREMMIYHTRDLLDPLERVRQARAFLEFLVESIPAQEGVHGSLLSTYANFLKTETGRLSGKNTDSFLLHDELETFNDPVYFHQFAAHAGRHGLQYVAEAELMRVIDDKTSAQTGEALGHMARDLIDLEQYTDFIHNRTFRQSLLCHAGLAVSRSLKVERLLNLYVAARALPVSAEPDLNGPTIEEFRAFDGGVLKTDHPVSKAALRHLGEIWPRAIAFRELVPAAIARLAPEARPPADPKSLALEAEVLGVNLLRAYTYSRNLVELHSYPPPLVSGVSPRPQVSPIARFQLAEDNRITNLYHERVELEGIVWYLFRYLDGTRSAEDLVNVLLAGPVAQGVLKVEQDHQPVHQPAKIRQLLGEEVAASLRWLSRTALLMG